MSRAEPSSGDFSPMAGGRLFDADLVFYAVKRQKPPSKAPPQDHDLGLQHDLGAFLNRRRALVALVASTSAIGALSALGKGLIFPTAQAVPIAKASDGRECLLDPAETEGPFPSDGSNSAHGTLSNVLKSSGIVRRDMRTDIGKTAATAEGQAFDLEITLVNVGQACAPLAGHAIYLWHCDALGRYSIYDLPNASYLRAVGVTELGGQCGLHDDFSRLLSGALSAHPFRSLTWALNKRRVTKSSAHLANGDAGGGVPRDLCRLETLRRQRRKFHLGQRRARRGLRRQHAKADRDTDADSDGRRVWRVQGGADDWDKCVALLRSRRDKLLPVCA